MSVRVLALAVFVNLPCAGAWAQDAAAGGSDAVQAPQATSPLLARGIASWYGPRFHGRRTSSGERFDMNRLTAAHGTLPFGTRLRVRNEANGREVIVRINDRLPQVRDRIIDLSKAAAAALGFVKAGEASVVLMEQRED